MSSSPDEIRKHMKGYWFVGYTLCTFTVVTVLLAVIPALDFGAPGTTAADIVFALAIATFKCSLVVLIFMHLNHERGLIYKMLLFTMAFAAGLMGLTLFARADPIRMYTDVVDEVAPQNPGLQVVLEGKPAEAAKAH